MNDNNTYTEISGYVSELKPLIKKNTEFLLLYIIK